MNIENEDMRSAMKDTIYSRCLSHIRTRVMKENDITTIFTICLEEIVIAVRAGAGTFWIYENENNVIVPYASYGGSDLTGIVLAPGQGIAGKVIETGSPIIVENVNRNRDWANSTDYKTGYTTDSILCVPVIYMKETIGCIQLINPTSNNSFEKKDTELLNSLVEYLFNSRENSEFAARLMAQKSSIMRDRILDSNVKAMNNVFACDSLDSVLRSVKSSKKYAELDEGRKRKYTSLVKKIWDVHHKKNSIF